MCSYLFIGDSTVYPGNFLTQTVSVLLTTSGIFLLALSTWQYSVVGPECCRVPSNTSTVLSWYDHTEAHNWSGNCSELHKIVPLQYVSLHMSPDLIIVLAVLGLVVSNTDHTFKRSRKEFLFRFPFSFMQLVMDRLTPYRVSLLLINFKKR